MSIREKNKIENLKEKHRILKLELHKLFAWKEFYTKGLERLDGTKLFDSEKYIRSNKVKDQIDKLSERLEPVEADIRKYNDNFKSYKSKTKENGTSN